MRIVQNKMTYVFKDGELETQVIPHVEFMKAHNYRVLQRSEITKHGEDELSITYDMVVNNNVESQEATQEIVKMKQKAAKWDNLNNKIAEFYCDESGEYSEENPKRRGDLGDIGEVAATALGWL